MANDVKDYSGKRFTRRDVLKVAGLGAAAVFLEACGARSSASNPGSNAAAPTAAAGGAAAPAAPAVVGKGATLNVAIPGTQIDPLMQAQAQAFMSKNGNIKINFTPLPGDWPQIFSKLLTMVAAGNSPDLALVATEGLQLFAGQGLALPLDDYIKRDKDAMQDYFSDVHPALVQGMMYQGSLYVLPNDFNAADMFYDTALFQKAGVDRPADEWDMNTFSNIASKLTQKSGNQTSVYGFGWTNRIWGSWTSFAFANGTNLLKAEQAQGGSWMWDTFYKGVQAAQGRGGGWHYTAAQANDPAVVEALQYVVDLRKQGVSLIPGEGQGQLLQGFFTGDKLGMTPAGGFWAGGLHNAGMKPNAFDVVFFPKWKVQRMEFGTAGLAMLKGTKNKDAAWEYMKYFNTKEAMTQRFKDNGTTPCRRSMCTVDRYQPSGPAHWQVFYDTLDKFPDTAPIPAPPEFQRLSDIFTKYTSLAMSLQQDPKTALDGMQRELAPLIKA